MDREDPLGRSGRLRILAASAALLAFAGLLLPMASASARPLGTTVQLFSLASGLNPARARSLAFAPEGELWFAGYEDELADDSSSVRYGRPIGMVGHVSADGEVVDVPLGASQRSPVGAITAGPDGAMWFTLSGDDEIGRVTSDGTISRFPVPPGSHPGAIVTGPDGNLWFTEPGLGRIGRMTPTGSLQEYVFAHGAASGIAVGPDSDLWFTLKEPGRIGRLTTAGERAVFPLPKGIRPGAIVATAAGLWFTERSTRPGTPSPSGEIGHLSTDGRFRRVSVPSRTPIVALADGANGRLWYAAKGYPGAIGSISPGGTTSRLRCIGSPECATPPIALAVAPDGKLWFATGTGECQICGGGTAIGEQYESGFVGYLTEPQETDR